MFVRRRISIFVQRLVLMMQCWLLLLLLLLLLGPVASFGLVPVVHTTRSVTASSSSSSSRRTCRSVFVAPLCRSAWAAQYYDDHHHRCHSPQGSLQLQQTRRSSSSSSSSQADEFDRDQPELDDVRTTTTTTSTTTTMTTMGVIQQTSLALRRLSWFSWWSQVILTTVSTVILVFARNVLAVNVPTSYYRPHWFLSSAGLVAGGASILWTWGNGWRLSRRLIRPTITRMEAAHLLRRAIRVGVTLNLIGLLLHLLAAEEIVGGLAVRVLTNPTAINPNMGGVWSTASAMTYGLQPLDVLIVQANTNALLSHFCSLVTLLWLTNRFQPLESNQP